ncbi:Alginate biosynthesis sensor protein KinB [Marinomonas aquimarina]|uniref:histidine kinase n=1 Tax=Marinomonas aquimarina TaxID=295068 RepID=A0A1A8TFX8_9GAMM|nr:HAMP domain-containing sensor histidine kinase [Marinomonas aquimarina]SBS31111.1 Alginate biosynthesis sensor protein KinB [Marinomonas aquimarina]
MKRPLIIIYLLPLLLVVLGAAVVFQLWQEQLRERLRFEQVQLINRGTAVMSRELGHIKQVVEYMGGELQERLTPDRYPDEEAWRVAVAQYFSRVQGLSDYVSQIRWLAPNGLEKVRINVRDRQVEWVPLAELQDKSNRYYFTEGIAADASTVLMTPIDLNIENGNIVRPYEVTIRASLKVQDASQQTLGLLVLNYNLNYLFTRLRSMQSAHNTLEMVNTKGEWLLAARPELEWLHLYGDILSSFANTYPASWQGIDQSQSLTPIQLPDGRPLSSSPVHVDEGTSQAPYYYFLSQVRADVWRQERSFIALAVITMAVVAYTILTSFGLLWWRNSEQRRKNLAHITAEKAALESTQQKLTEANKTLLSLQDELVEKGRLSSLGLMVAGVGHELNTPLGGIRLNLSALQHLKTRIEPHVDAEVLELYTSSTELAMHNLKHAMNVIQQFKRITQQQADSGNEVFNVQRMLEDTLSPLKSMLKKHDNIQIALHVDPDLTLDSAQDVLSQVLQNLILNALEHAFMEGQPGAIHITAQQEDDFVLEVADDGQGIPAQLLSTIWEPFVTTGRGKQHSGLGLYMVHQWVTRLLHGKIEVRSDEQGTRFTIIIPN